PGGHVGDAEPERRQQPVLVRRQPPRREAGAVQGGPEAVARAGEVVAALGRQQRRVDAAEQDAQTGAEDVRQGLHASARAAAATASRMPSASTSRWVTARTVPGPSGVMATPSSRSRARNAGASGTSKTTMFVSTAAGSTVT